MSELENQLEECGVCHALHPLEELRSFDDTLICPDCLEDSTVVCGRCGERLTVKGVEFVSRKEAIDTTTPSGKFMLTIFGAVAELEREYILQRQKEGIAIAKANGTYKGRPPTACPDFDRVVTLWQSGEITAQEAARRLGISPSTFYRKLKGGKSSHE